MAAQEKDLVAPEGAGVVCPITKMTMAVTVPPFLRVRQAVGNWRALGAPQDVMQLLVAGVQPDLPLPPCLSMVARH